MHYPQMNYPQTELHYPQIELSTNITIHQYKFQQTLIFREEEHVLINDVRQGKFIPFHLFRTHRCAHFYKKKLEMRIFQK